MIKIPQPPGRISLSRTSTAESGKPLEGFFQQIPCKVHEQAYTSIGVDRQAKAERPAERKSNFLPR